MAGAAGANIQAVWPRPRQPEGAVQDALATREALVGAALELFTERGYSEVGTEEIVSAPRSPAVRSTTTSRTSGTCSAPCTSASR